MSNQVQNSLDLLHPILKDICVKIQTEIIQKHSMPFKLFETGRNHERHQFLLTKGRTQTVYSKHSYCLDSDVPLYSVAVDYVFFNGRWSWNLRDQTVVSWYTLFGNMILDSFPDIQWGGNFRKSANYTHYELRKDTIIENVEKFPCVLHLS